MSADVPSPARLIARLMPVADREAILGDLVEEAQFRSLSGLHRTLWMIGECATIGAGISWTRVRRTLVVPDAHGLTMGLVLDGRHALRSAHLRSAGVRALVFCGSVAILSFATALLVSSLLSAAGL